jgi:hypothetical protein
VRLDGSEMDLLVQWIERREAVRRAKAAGQPWPWTQDPPLQQWRWCNVRRMDDRVSLALLRRWYAPSATDAATALVSACLARLVNWPDLLMAITAGETFALRHLERARERLQARAEDGEKVFTGAYVVPGRPGEGKVLTVVNHARNVRDGAAKLWGSSMRQTWANLTRLDGLGSFLAGQMVADLAALPAGAGWTDVRTWAPLGPGSARGINRVFGRPKDKAVSQGQFEQELPFLIGMLRPRIEEIWADRDLIAMDVQNCLCEFDKYRRLTLGEGSVRARYERPPQPALI